LTIPATAHNVITVASYDHRDSVLADSSSRGPTTDARPAGEGKPDITAPGVGVTSVKSAVRNTGICCDCCQDFYVAMSGTSMAAPHITGIVALIFQRNRSLTWEQVRAHLRATADPPDPITGPTLPNSDWGAGVVNAEVAAAGVPALAAAGDSPVLTRTLPGSDDLPGTAEWGGHGPQVSDRPRVPAQVPSIAAMIEGGPGAERLRELRRAVRATPMGQLAAALISTHLDEVLRLVNSDRRVMVAWHRMNGPDLVRLVLQTPPGEPMALPATMGGHPIAAGLARLLDALAAAGSSQLHADVVRHRALLLSLPGLNLDDLGELAVGG
jgi:Subtilase family